MNARMPYLGRSELAALIVCGALVLLTAGAVGQRGRTRAKDIVCQANLQQWNGHFQDYARQHDGRFYSGCSAQGYWWPLQLPWELQDWKRNRTWFCPAGTRPVLNEQGQALTTLTFTTAWGVFKPDAITYKGATYSVNPSGLSGSYAINGYVIPIPETSTSPWSVNLFASGVSAREGWRNLLAVPNGNAVPVFIEALRFDLWPLPYDRPAQDMWAAWTGSQVARCCIDRHDGGVNCLFADGSVRKVGLKELWTLKWHRSFNTNGPWTRAGGVQPMDWPEWIRSFKDY